MNKTVTRAVNRSSSSHGFKASRQGEPARSRIGLAAAGLLCGILLGLLAFAPARWLAAALPASSPLQLSEARGTVWQGSAQLWLTGGAGSPDRAALPQRVRWQTALSWQGPELQLQADCCTPQGMRMSLGLNQGTPVLRIGDGRSNWPAELLSGLGTPWNTLEPSGRLSLRTQSLGVQLTRQGPQLTGQASLEIEDLGSALSTLRPMGSYRVMLQGAPDASVQLHTVRGDLVLSGQGRWTASGLRFQGEARAAPGREEALGNILNIIGRRDGARTLISLG